MRRSVTVASNSRPGFGPAFATAACTEAGTASAVSSTQRLVASGVAFAGVPAAPVL